MPAGLLAGQWLKQAVTHRDEEGNVLPPPLQAPPPLLPFPPNQSHSVTKDGGPVGWEWGGGGVGCTMYRSSRHASREELQITSQSLQQGRAGQGRAGQREAYTQGRPGRPPPIEYRVPSLTAHRPVILRERLIIWSGVGDTRSTSDISAFYHASGDFVKFPMNISACSPIGIEIGMNIHGSAIPPRAF